MIKNTPILLFLFCFIIGQGSAQNPIADVLRQQFTTYQQNNLQEKLFVHTDKPNYLVGEVCWFKVYNVDAFFHTPLSISKVVYVEILDKNHKPALQTKIEMQEGSGNGSLLLPTTLMSGNYTFRAYTNWMKNFGADYFFEKPLTIINSKEASESDTPVQEAKNHLRFFPEGGNLVNDIPSKVAFHLVNSFGKGLDASGVVLTDKKDTVARFSTTELGMGSFVLTPKPNQTYTAIATLTDGQKVVAQIPTAFTEGYVLNLEEAGEDKIKVMVFASAQNASANIYLLAHTRGILSQILMSTPNILRGGIENNVATFLIDKTKIGAGITHFTVFNADKQPVCERLYFKYPDQYLNIQTTTDAPVYGQRKNIKVSVSTADQAGKPIAANLSMSVYALDTLQNGHEMDINNYLWLSSDLTGTIETPEYYFQKDKKNTSAIDNLMVTHGWRKFKWADVLENKKQVFDFVPEYIAPLIAAKVTTGTGLAAAKIATYLSVPNSNTPFRPALSDAQGRVFFEMKNFDKNRRIIVQAEGSPDSTYKVVVANPFSEQLSRRLLSPFSLSQINAETLLNQHKGVQIQNIYNAKRQEPITKPLDTTAFYLKPDVTYLLDNYVRFTRIEEILAEYVPSVNIKLRNNKVHFQVWDAVHNQFFDTDPLVLLDGTPILNKDQFMNYDPLKIKRLDIVSRMYYLGNLSCHGILNFITYKGTLPDYVLDPQTTVIDYEGLQEQRIFYAPEYATPKQQQSRLPDFRNLLHWLPNLKTPINGKVNLNFYSSDLQGKYAVVIQGLTADGKTGSQVVVIEVK